MLLNSRALIKYILYSVILLAAFSMFSQRESANWCFGDFAGLNFNSGNPVPFQSSQLITKEGCATISDETGNLLFYTDGTTVWDRQNQIMPNGTGLLGHSSSTMSALIIPKPGNTNAFYIFTIDKPSYFLTEGEPIDGVNYSEVDMTLNNGFGDLVASNKNNPLITYDVSDPIQSEYKSSEKITAVTHSDGSSIWVITQFMNKFFAFRVDYNGVNETPVVSTVPQNVYPRINEIGANISAIGYMKVSPNGKKIAIAHSATTLGSPTTGTKKSGKVLLYDFNNTTGIVSNQKNIISDTYPYGVEFSPNSKLLYITVSNFTTEDIFLSSDLFQYNLESSDIIGSRQNLKNSSNVAGALQLAIDGKIYRAGYQIFNSGLKLSVINSPNSIGMAANYAHNSVDLGGKQAELGLPPFIQSIFKFTFDYEFTCFGDNTHFFITSEDPYDSVVWNFGDGQTSTLEEPYHTYTQPGVYTVSLSLTLNGITNDPLIKVINITEVPEVLQTTYELTQCDSFDDDPDDGVSTFNLELANNPLTLNSTDSFKVYYYHTLTDAQNDLDNTNALNPVYTNQTQGEILYAKVYRANTNCFSMATIKLTTTQAVDLDVFQLEACDSQHNGQATFNLDLARNDIINSLNLPNNVTISFYQTENDAGIGINALSDDFTSASKTLYIRAESDNICYGNGLLELIVQPFPTLEDQTVIVCQSDFPIYIDSGLSTYEVPNYTYLWNTNQTTNSILVNAPGVYTLTVSDPNLNCEDTLTVTVVQNDIANIENISIDEYHITINLTMPTDGFEFAIDNINGNYQQNNEFFGVQPGDHVVYVRDVYGCNTISQPFHIIGFPKYFTPNGDGENDTWNIKGLDANLYPNLHIQIFNRYGKLLKIFNPNQSNGWNGTYNGHLLTPDDYWYYLELPDGKKYKGHFSLKI
ncbi:MAG: T9SS type B sorting domain-containing protein [Gelidibacter sp.]